MIIRMAKQPLNVLTFHTCVKVNVGKGKYGGPSPFPIVCGCHGEVANKTSMWLSEHSNHFCCSAHKQKVFIPPKEKKKVK